MVPFITQADGSLQMEDGSWPTRPSPKKCCLHTKSPEQLLLIPRTHSFAPLATFSCRGQKQGSSCLTHSCWLPPLSLSRAPALQLSLGLPLSNRLSWWSDLIGQKWSPHSSLWPNCWTGHQQRHACSQSYSLLTVPQDLHILWIYNRNWAVFFLYNLFQWTIISFMAAKLIKHI